jgi:hypothetical protein
MNVEQLPLHRRLALFPSSGLQHLAIFFVEFGTFHHDSNRTNPQHCCQEYARRKVGTDHRRLL